MSRFVDQLISAIQKKDAAVCVGLDPMIDQLPAAIAGPVEKRASASPERQVEWAYSFCIEVLRAVAPVAPIVKPQIAYFEQLGVAGIQAYYCLMRDARDLGLLTIGDVKRGDIGSTSEAYAAAHLHDPRDADDEETAAPDAITINPMLGLDAIEPFVKTAASLDKGLFVLVRTSNPGSKDFQDVELKDGRSWSELVADTLHTVATRTDMMGGHGYSSVGAVVGATQTHTMASIRKRLPASFFLLPGYGTQGATADMTRAAFDDKGLGAIVSASRSVLYPKPVASRWTDDVKEAAKKMAADINEIRKR
jgi:orotidine-5'-phosphate decarboxylase